MSIATTSNKFVDYCNAANFQIETELKEDMAKCQNRDTHAIFLSDAYLVKGYLTADIVNMIAAECNLSLLNTATSVRKLSPLHIAVMTGNVKVATALLDAGVNVNPADNRMWTPLHHAAMLGNNEMISLLCERQADKKALTNTRMTYQDILALTQEPVLDPKALVPVYWKEGNQEHQMTQEEFQKMTGAKYYPGYIVDRTHLLQCWCEPEKVDEFVFVDQLAVQYERSLKNPPTYSLCMIPPNEFGVTRGKAMFARTAHKAREFCDGYWGQVSPYEGLRNKTSEDAYYAFSYGEGVYDPTKYGTCGRMMNDGFPNVYPVKASTINPLILGPYFIFLNNIRPGEELTWDYGLKNQAVKMGPYIEIHPKETRDFIKLHLNHLPELSLCAAKLTWETTAPKMKLEIAKEAPQYIKTLKVDKKLTFDEFVLAVKFKYILNTPPVQYLMILDRTVSVKTGKELYTLAINAGYLVENEYLKIMIPVAEKCLQCEKELCKYSEPAANIFKSFVMEMPARYGIEIALAKTHGMIRSISQKFPRIGSALAITFSTQKTKAPTKAEVEEHIVEIVAKVKAETNSTEKKNDSTTN